MAKSIKLSPEAYGVLFLHCCKHPHRSLNGLLLGTVEGDSINATEALPLFHSSLALAPMLEAALLAADEYCSQRSKSGSKLQIVGYYQANELVDDFDLGAFGKKISDKIYAQSSAVAILMVCGCLYCALAERPRASLSFLCRPCAITAHDDGSCARSSMVARCVHHRPTCGCWRLVWMASAAALRRL